jgi:hypothetical protein
VTRRLVSIKGNPKLSHTIFGNVLPKGLRKCHGAEFDLVEQTLSLFVKKVPKRRIEQHICVGVVVVREKWRESTETFNKVLVSDLHRGHYCSYWLTYRIYVITPMAQISALVEYGSFLIISGAVKSEGLAFSEQGGMLP